MAQERKYFVKMNWRTNLDTMNTKLWNIIYDMREGKYETIEIMGEVMDIDRIYDFQDEVQDLMAVMNGRVTGKEYGRIKAISDERNMMRYKTCLNSGMSEAKASYAFLD